MISRVLTERLPAAVFLRLAVGAAAVLAWRGASSFDTGHHFEMTETVMREHGFQYYPIGRQVLGFRLGKDVGEVKRAKDDGRLPMEDHNTRIVVFGEDAGTAPAPATKLRFLLSYYPAAYDVDRTPGTNAIRQRLDNLSEAGTLYGAIIYQKAPIVMRQLETMLGEDGFRDGLREYLRAHAFGNATWPDLIKVLDARTPEDLQTWSHAWVEEAGRPNVATMLPPV